jgi:hypothetical protein
VASFQQVVRDQLQHELHQLSERLLVELDLVRSRQRVRRYAVLGRNGRSIYISGPLDCPEGGTATIDVTVTHEGGAIAGGQAKVQCQADTAEFTATLATNGANVFPPLSQVKACGTAQISRRGANASAFQWCRDVTLVPEGVELQDDE